MLKVGVGHSNDPDSEAAIAEILEQCRNTLGETIPNAGILFAAIDFDYPLILQQIQAVYPDIELIGGTTDGELSSKMGFQQDSLVLMLFCSDTINIVSGVGHGLSKNGAVATRQAIAQAQTKTHLQPQLCLTIFDALESRSSQTLEHLKQTLGQRFPIFGGCAGDSWKFQQTHQFHHNELLNDSIVVLLFAGELQFSHSIASGWKPIGERGQVTRTQERQVCEIDHKPALEFYDRYLDRQPPSGEYPLAVFEPNSDQFYLRAPWTHDPNSGSITILDEIPEQSLVQIAFAKREDILAASKESLDKALSQFSGTPTVALFFSCASRRRILGVQTKKEYQIAETSLPPTVASCGFYSYGEVAPIGDGETQIHNETFVTLLLGEK
jgi:hypothetical protein